MGYILKCGKCSNLHETITQTSSSESTRLIITYGVGGGRLCWAFLVCLMLKFNPSLAFIVLRESNRSYPQLWSRLRSISIWAGKSPILRRLSFIKPNPSWWAGLFKKSRSSSWELIRLFLVERRRSFGVCCESWDSWLAMRLSLT